MVAPILNALMEMAMWWAIFAARGGEEVGGYGRSNYLLYALWAMFFSRVGANWMYEFRMIDEIDTGKVNSLLVRPMTFFQYYLGQFVGYKALTASLSLLIPFAICLWTGGVDLWRLPLCLLLTSYYILFVYTLSFSVACLAFFFNRVQSFSAAKNISLWLLTGELFPLDLVPTPYKDIVISLPFSSCVYMPVGYLTGRVNLEQMQGAFVSITLGLVVAGLLASWIWDQGRKSYSGTGA